MLLLIKYFTDKRGKDMIISKHEDKAFKILIDFTMHDFLKGIGIADDIVIPLPTELMTTNCINRRLDYCGLSSKYEIINVEFQSSLLTKGDEIRIFDYASSLFVKFKLPVKTFIISTVEDKCRKIEKWHHNDVFTIYVISLKDKDGLESLNSIKSKIRNKETFNGEDIVSLISIVFMKSPFSEKDLLFEVADLTNKARFEFDFIKDQVKSILLILGDKFIKSEEELEHFKGIIMMGSGHLSSILAREKENYRKEVREEFIEEGISKGIDIGFEKGDENRAISIAKWMLGRDMSVDDISEATGLSVEKINSLKK